MMKLVWGGMAAVLMSLAILGGVPIALVILNPSPTTLAFMEIGAVSLIAGIVLGFLADRLAADTMTDGQMWKTVSSIFFTALCSFCGYTLCEWGWQGAVTAGTLSALICAKLIAAPVIKMGADMADRGLVPFMPNWMYYLMALPVVGWIIGWGFVLNIKIKNRRLQT